MAEIYSEEYYTMPTPEQLLENSGGSVYTAGSLLNQIDSKIKKCAQLVNSFGPGATGSGGTMGGGSISLSRFTDPFTGVNVDIDFEVYYNFGGNGDPVDENRNFSYIYNVLNYIDPNDIEEAYWIGVTSTGYPKPYIESDFSATGYVYPRADFINYRDEIRLHIRFLTGLTDGVLTSPELTGEALLDFICPLKIDAANDMLQTFVDAIKGFGKDNSPADDLSMLVVTTPYHSPDLPAVEDGSSNFINIDTNFCIFYDATIPGLGTPIGPLPFVNDDGVLVFAEPLIASTESAIDTSFYYTKEYAYQYLRSALTSLDVYALSDGSFTGASALDTIKNSLISLIDEILVDCADQLRTYASDLTEYPVWEATEAAAEDVPTWGLPDGAYDALVEEGVAVVPCDDPPAVEVSEECPPCIEDPNAIVPDWRYKEEGDVFLNGKTCQYCVTVNSGETDVTILNDTATREAFLEEQRLRGVNLILEYFGKTPIDSASLEIILGEALSEQFEVPLRPLMPIRTMVCVPVALIDALILINVEEDPEEIPIGPAGCVLKAEEIRQMIKVTREAFRYYGHKYALWSWDTGQVIENFDPYAERDKLNLFVPALVQLMNRNGFKLNGKNAAEKVEFRFNENYELIYAQANELKCEPVELIWKKDGDNLGGFKQLEPINDPRTMAYIAAMNDLYVDAQARDPKAWDEFFTEYTYPPINTDDVIDPIGDPVMADGPMQQAAQSIVNDIVGLPDAIANKFGQQVCRDRKGQAIHDADIRNFDDMLKRAIYSKGQQIQVGDDTFLNLPALLGKSSNLDDLYQNVLNKLGRCGLLDLLSMAVACLTKGIDLETALSIMVKAALKAMDPGNLEKLFIGLPQEKQLEIKQKIADAGWGSIPAPWEAGYRPGSYSYKVDLNDDGTPIGEEYYTYDETTDPPEMVVVDAQDDNRSIAERTASYRMEAQGTEFGGAGSVGTAADKTFDAIFEAYVEAILDSVDADYLLEQLNKFPGAEIITKFFKNPDCPPAPLFNPPLKDFMKTLELDFCRDRYHIVWPKFQKIRIPDLWKMFMEALLEVLMQLAVKIIMAILEMILKLLLNAMCNLLGLLGDMVSGLFANQPTNSFADSIKDTISNTGLNSLGMPAPLADDEAINNAAANLFSAFSRSCTDPADLPTGEQASDFMNEVGLILTQGEFMDLLRGQGADEVYGAVYQLVLIRHQSFLCIFPNVSSIKDFFSSLGSMIDSDFMTAEPGQPVFPGVCSDVSGANQIDELRRQLLGRQGLDVDLVEAQIELLKCQAVSDLEDLINIAQNGIFANVPPLIDSPGCDTPGILPRDPSPESLPTGPLAMTQGPFGLFEGTFDIMDKFYYKDLMGKGGFLNMVLSDRDGRGRREHNTFVAMQSVFGIFSPRPNTHEELLPVSVSKYLEWILKNPGAEHENSVKFITQPFAPDGVPNTPDMILGYSNYFPDTEEEWYEFELNYTHADYDSAVLNNRYRVVLDEVFNYTKDPAIEETPTGTFSERLAIDADPGLPDGVQEFIETELGLDIESTLVSGTPEGTTAAALSPQAVVFGKYIEKILRDAIPAEALGDPTTEASLSFIADACMTDMFNYINSAFFSMIAGTIADNNMAFLYGEGGDMFEGNKPTTYAPTKIFLDETHVHPVTGVSQPLDPLAWGGNSTFPAHYDQPAQNRPGWCGITDRMIPEPDACDPKRENIIGFKEITNYITDFYQKIEDDERLNTPTTCAIEEPCNKILGRAAAAMIEGNIKATIRIYAAEAFLKGAPAFTKFKPDLGELYEDPMAAYITETLKRGFYVHSKKGFGRRRNDEYYFQFLEQCVQNFGRKVDAGLVEPTLEEQESLDVINALQQIWKKDTSPSSGKPYANTGERLKRVLSPGFFGAQLKNIFNSNYNVPLNDEEGALSARAAEKLKEKSWDYFMREIAPAAEVIVKRYVAEELKYIGDEFAERIPPQYRTLYEILLGHDRYGCYGNINFGLGAVPDSSPLADEHPFAVAASANNVDPEGDGVPTSPATGEIMRFLYEYRTPSGPGPNPASVVCTPPDDDSSDRYWPFVLEQYIEVEDYTMGHWVELAESGVDLAAKYGGVNSAGQPDDWTEVMLRDSNLFGVIKMSEWKKYLEDNASLLASYNRSDLWKSWSYGLRIIFVPPNQSGDSYTYLDGTTIAFDDGTPGTSQAMPKSVQIKDKIQEWASATASGTPFDTYTTQENKAFYFTGTESFDANPMSIPVAKGTLDMPMNINCTDLEWTTSYDAAGGLAPLVQELVCSNEYKMLFRYCFNMPRMLSVVGIYIIQAFLPSIGKAAASQPSFGPEWPSELPVDVSDNARAADDSDGDDGWYEPKGLESLFAGPYEGGGLSLGFFPYSRVGLLLNLMTTNFKEWNFHKAFYRTKKLAAQSFMDLYNSENPNYTSDAFSDTSIQEDARGQINVSWPKFGIRLWSKEVDRPYDMNGDICYDPDDDYSD